MIATTAEPPYYAVIFTSVRTQQGNEDYHATAERMFVLASHQPGFLGVESAREGIGITVAYFQDLDSIRAWKRHAEHLEAQRRGRDEWYQRYTVRIARVERDYSFEA